MRDTQLRLALSTIFCFCVLLVPGLPGTLRASVSTQAAKGVLHRLIGNRADAFAFRDIDSVAGHDVFEVQAADGKVSVAGSSGVAMCRGAYEYLRRTCHAQASWDGNHLDLPAKFPDMPPLRVVCPNRYRHYFNVCTFGYTMVWWDWDRWQREIDWMALHGINLPLAMNGQEAIWQRVWKSYGLSDADLAGFFSGPAFLPWHRMGNLNGHGGPLPQHWIDSDLQLQKKILARERELGMTPITPAFGGFVPEAFARAHPNARFRKSSGWCGFEPTVLLDAGDPLFVEVGEKFIKQYINECGSDHLYLADTFNEMRPQVQPDTRLAELSALSKSVFKSIEQGDPQGVWVMQGWLFFNDREFWKTDAVSALLDPIPDDRMLLIDLACESMQVWRTHESFRRKNWLFCTLHDYGQKTPLQGDLPLFASYGIKALRDADHGKMAGMGITPEGIEQNAVVYELLTDMMWRDEPVDRDRWIADYCTQRYGSYPPAMREAWDLLRQTVYSTQDVPRRIEYELRPELNVDYRVDAGQFGKLSRALQRMLDCADLLGSSDLYRRDVVDLAKRVLEEHMAKLTGEAIDAYRRGDRQALLSAAKEHAQAMSDLDRLLRSRAEYSLQKWLDAARARAASPDEADLYERNARMQITVWGRPVVNDYARKEWSGLTRDYYAPRWQMFFDALLRSDPQHPFDAGAWDRSMSAWENDWSHKLGSIEPGGDSTDAIGEARQVMRKYGKL